MKDSSLPSKGLTKLEWGVILVVVGGGSYLFVLPAFSRQYAFRPRTQCISNVKQLDLALVMYQGDYDDRMPSADRWVDHTRPYTGGENIYHDTADGLTEKDYGYAFRKAASGLDVKKLAAPAQYVVVFDSTKTERNASGGLSLLPKPGRHGGSDTVGYADGHVRSLKADNLSALYRDDKAGGPEMGPTASKKRGS